MSAEKLKNCVLGVGLSVFIVCVLSVSIILSTWDAAFQKLAILNRDQNNHNIPPANFNGISIIGNISTVDREKFKYMGRFHYLPFGNMSEKGALTTPSHVQVGWQHFDFKSGADMAPSDLEFLISDGNPSIYPFDEYSAEFSIQATTGQAKIPLSVSLAGQSAEWRVHMIMTASIDYTFVHVTLTISRAPSQQFFSLFVAGIMWVMSLGVFWMSFAHVWYYRKVEPPTVGVVITMLFALPAVRNIQPGNPPIGCTMDVVGFFWNMGIVTVASLILLYRFSFQDSKLYVPLQRGRTNASMFRRNSGFPTVGNLAQDNTKSEYELVPLKSALIERENENSKLKNDNKDDYGAFISAPLKSEKSRDSEQLSKKFKQSENISSASAKVSFVELNQPDSSSLEEDEDMEKLLQKGAFTISKKTSPLRKTIDDFNGKDVTDGFESLFPK